MIKPVVRYLQYTYIRSAKQTLMSLEFQWVFLTIFWCFIRQFVWIWCGMYFAGGACASNGACACMRTYTVSTPIMFKIWWTNTYLCVGSSRPPADTSAATWWRSRWQSSCCKEGMNSGCWDSLESPKSSRTCTRSTKSWHIDPGSSPRDTSRYLLPVRWYHVDPRSVASFYKV